MKRLIPLIALALLSLAGCKKSGESVDINGFIEGSFEGALTLKILDVSQLKTVDTIAINSEGEFNYRVKLRGTNPDFYYLYHNDNRVASLILSPGEEVDITTDLARGYSKISGSPESVLLNRIEGKLDEYQHQFDSLYLLAEKANLEKNSARSDELNYLLGGHFVKAKREAMSYLYKFPNSLTNLTLLYYKFRPEVPLFGSLEDRLLYRKVLDSLSLQYPTLPYLKALQSEVENREKIEQFSYKLKEAEERGFPNISLPDINSNQHQLSDVEERAILLVFWTVTDPSQTMLNNDYKELYSQYHKRGFQIFQVSADIDKGAWASVVRSQEVPWITLCDGLGSNSPALRTYNVTELPANFLIDREGSIVAKDLSIPEIKRELNKILRK